MSQRLNGKIIANTIADQLKEQISRQGLLLTLGIIQVGSHPSSSAYIQHKIKMSSRLGIQVRHQQLAANITQPELLDIIKQWNKDVSITGFIVQLPLPTQLNSEQIVNAIEPKKDVDGLTAVNKGLLATGKPTILPATTRGIISLMDYYEIDVAGKHAVVMGRSNLVGIPTALALLQRHATVTVLHSQSQDTQNVLPYADIVIVAIGKPSYLTAELLSPEAIVIDVGITSVDGQLRGDVDFEQVKDIVKAITPVPGGIGPLTVISLFQNLVDIASNN